MYIEHWRRMTWSNCLTLIHIPGGGFKNDLFLFWSFEEWFPIWLAHFVCRVETANFVILWGLYYPATGWIITSHYKDPNLLVPTTGFGSHCSLPATLPASCRYMMHHPFAWLSWHVSKYAEEGKLHEKDHFVEFTIYKTNSSPLKIDLWTQQESSRATLHF